VEDAQEYVVSCQTVPYVDKTFTEERKMHNSRWTTFEQSIFIYSHVRTNTEFKKSDICKSAKPSTRLDDDAGVLTLNKDSKLTRCRRSLQETSKR